MKRQEIDQAIQSLLRERGAFSSGELSERTGRSRQALQLHLRRWMEAGRLVREGRGRATRYRSVDRLEVGQFERTFPTPGLAEERVWEELFTWLSSRPVERTEAADQVLAYVVTELVNNAIDHSGAAHVSVRAELFGERASATVTDAGIGAFESIRRKFGLEDALHALQELSKGKVTTQPERHSGEGLFFSSKMVTHFELVANDLAWVVDNELPDQAVCELEHGEGTEVRVELSLQASTRPEEVFAAYTHDFEFDSTRCVIRLFEYGRRFVSRSEAKRVAANLDRFREVILDFHGVEGVGQGFVDELFRVWARSHPQVKLVPQRMNTAVEFMVRRGLPPTVR